MFLTIKVPAKPANQIKSARLRQLEKKASEIYKFFSLIFVL